MSTNDLIGRCEASIADDKKHGLTYRTCRAEDFEALVEIARLAADVIAAFDEEKTDYTDAIDALRAGLKNDTPQ